VLVPNDWRQNKAKRHSISFFGAYLVFGGVLEVALGGLAGLVDVGNNQLLGVLALIVVRCGVILNYQVKYALVRCGAASHHDVVRLFFLRIKRDRITVRIDALGREARVLISNTLFALTFIASGGEDIDGAGKLRGWATSGGSHDVSISHNGVEHTVHIVIRCTAFGFVVRANIVISFPHVDVECYGIIALVVGKSGGPRNNCRANQIEIEIKHDRRVEDVVLGLGQHKAKAEGTHADE